MQSFDYIFNVGGNYTATISGMSETTGHFNASVETARNRLGKLTQSLAALDLFKNAVEGVNNAVNSFSAPGISLDRQMHDLSAVAGVVGEGLKQIEGYACSSAKAFGIDASQAVESVFTSNHNNVLRRYQLDKLYLIVYLHQTTTSVE